MHTWCGAVEVKVLEVEGLGDLFREVLRAYVPSSYEHGELVGDLLEEDWQIFGPMFEANSAGRNALATAILTADRNPKDDVDDPDYSGFFAREAPYSYDLEDHWVERMARLLEGSGPGDHGDAHGDHGDEFDNEGFALESVAESYPTPSCLYRARIHRDRDRRGRFGPEDMGAPPAEKADSGRANRKGQPVLYLASDDKTAVAEVRPWRSAAVAVAEMTTRSNLRVVDLRRVRKLTSPVGIEELRFTLQARALTRRFGVELATPVSPEEKARVYLPSQSICEVARRAGYDGIAYPSALGKGHNVVLFDTTAASAARVDYLRVSGVGHRSEPLTTDEIEPDAWAWSWVTR